MPGAAVIYLVVGEDAYKQRQAVNNIKAQVTCEPETYDGAQIDENQLADIIAGATLFSAQRLVIIHELSENKAIWDKLASWVNRVTSDTTLVLLERKPDRRTKTYKTIAKAATVMSVDMWTDRQQFEAVQWAVQRATELGAPLTRSQVVMLVSRAIHQSEKPGSYTIDQQQLENALQSLSALDVVTDESIGAVLPESHADNVFELLETALSGNVKRTEQLLYNLRTTADPYMTFGLLSSQWVNIAAIKLTTAPLDVLAGELSVSPYVLKKLQPYAQAMSVVIVKQRTRLLAELDTKQKTTGLEPWVAVDRFIGELIKK